MCFETTHVYFRIVIGKLKGYILVWCLSSWTNIIQIVDFYRMIDVNIKRLSTVLSDCVFMVKSSM